MIIKVSGVIIRDKKLLLVTADSQGFYWTPGGKLNTGETALEALKRELKEELQTEASDIKHFFDYLSSEEEDDKPRQVHTYLVELKDKPKCGQEISSLVWVSRNDIMNERVKLQLGIKNHLIPRLIKDSLI